MKINFKNTRTTTAVMIALTLTSCARFDERMQANGEFEYQDAKLTTALETGDFSRDEARDTYILPDLTEEQKKVGFMGIDVDIRPPYQFMPLLDNALLEKTVDGSTKVRFTASKQEQDMQAEVWSLLKSYFAHHEASHLNVESENQATAQLNETHIYGKYFHNTVIRDSSYHFNLESRTNSKDVILTVDLLDYKEVNNEEELKFSLMGNRKHNMELRFLNSLMAYGYEEQESQKSTVKDQKPLTIKLTFNDNHQNIWLVNSDFVDTWNKLPKIFSLLNFKQVESDRNLGYYLVEYEKPLPAYWEEHDLQFFDLVPNEYFVQIGEVSDNETSISWLDEDKKPLDDQLVTDIYLSISNYINKNINENRDVNKNEEQKPRPKKH